MQEIGRINRLSHFIRLDAATGSQRQRGFTLLELVASMVLMSILFAALTSLLRCFSEQERAILQFAESHPPTEQFAELLRRDLQGARFVRVSRERMTLVGNLAQDWSSGLATGRQAEVTYRIEFVGGDPWLIRHEVHLDELSSQRSRQELVWRGATGIELTAIAETMLNDSDQGSPASLTGMVPMPAHLHLVIRHNNGQSLLDLDVLHHWEDS